MNVSGGGGGHQLGHSGVDGPKKSSTAVAVPGSLCYDLEAPADIDTLTEETVFKGATTGVEEACDACVGWGNPPPPAPE